MVEFLVLSTAISGFTRYKINEQNLTSKQKNIVSIILGVSLASLFSLVELILSFIISLF